MKLLTLVPAPVLLVFLGAFIAMSKLQIADRWPIVTIPFALSLPVLAVLALFGFGYDVLQKGPQTFTREFAPRLDFHLFGSIGAVWVLLFVAQFAGGLHH